MKNTNLAKAKREGNDEFFTQLTDIENELKYYIGHFRNKVIYCNCDTPNSKFIEYFKSQPIKKLLRSSIQEGIDFRSPEAVKMLKESDIVVTNLPFSLFREYVNQLNKYSKKFIIIGNHNAITYKETFKLIKDNKLWLGHTHPKEFEMPNHYPLRGSSYINKKGKKIAKFGNVCWFTNLKINKRSEDLILYKKYIKKEYLKYDNYDVINVDKVKDIPVDYNGVMGVPITFLNKYNPEQFEIIGQTHSGDNSTEVELLRKDIKHKHRGIVHGETKEKYARILIKNRRL